MAIFVCFLQGAFELLGLSGFLVGYFTDIGWLMVLGGLFIVADDVVEVFQGILNPLFPVLLAVALAFLIVPWYVGVFWASAGFKVLGLPNALQKTFTPRRFITRSVERLSQPGS